MIIIFMDKIYTSRSYLLISIAKIFATAKHPFSYSNCTRAPCPSWAGYWRCRDIHLGHQLTNIILPISDHLHTLLYVFPLWNPIFLVLYSGIGCIACFLYKIILPSSNTNLYQLWAHLTLYYFNSSTHIFYYFIFLKHVGSPILLELHTTQEVPLPPYFSIVFVTLRTIFSLVGGRVEEGSFCY